MQRNLKILFLPTLILAGAMAIGAMSFDATEASVGNEFHGKTANPTELGLVNWMRDYEKAMQRAEAEGKPVFILFQEVPGCSNCTRFGRNVLSNPLIKDVIEHEFIPLCIYNNQGGKDAEILERFGEPAWNNPVVRIVTTEGKDIVPRMGQFSPKEVVAGIGKALVQRGELPSYFQALQTETNAAYRQTEEAVFSMFCFWSGELQLGQLKGVVATTPGFMGGQEVVKVTFDPKLTNYKEVVYGALKLDLVHDVFVTSVQQSMIAKEMVGAAHVHDASEFRVDVAPKYYLHQTAYKYVPMLQIQRINVNKALAERRDPATYLSPSQNALYKTLQKKKIKLPVVTLSNSLVKDWEKVLATVEF